MLLPVTDRLKALITSISTEAAPAAAPTPELATTMRTQTSTTILAITAVWDVRTALLPTTTRTLRFLATAFTAIQARSS